MPCFVKTLEMKLKINNKKKTSDYHAPAPVDCRLNSSSAFLRN